MTNLVAELRAMGTSNVEPDLEKMDALLLMAANEIEENRAALKVAQQSILEFRHAQECGPSWYTRGADGMYQQVSLWLRRGLEAVRGALGPYDDNGVYLKEQPSAEPSVLPLDKPAPDNESFVVTFNNVWDARYPEPPGQRIVDVHARVENGKGQLTIITKKESP